MTKVLLSSIGLFLLTYQNILANTTTRINVKGTRDNTAGDNTSSDGDFVQTLDNILGFIIGLLYFIAVAFALYGGFLILTAGGEEDRVKKGKTTLIQAVIGLIVIFLASQIITWVVGLFAGSNSLV